MTTPVRYPGSPQRIHVHDENSCFQYRADDIGHDAEVTVTRLEAEVVEAEALLQAMIARDDEPESSLREARGLVTEIRLRLEEAMRCMEEPDGMRQKTTTRGDDVFMTKEMWMEAQERDHQNRISQLWTSRKRLNRYDHEAQGTPSLKDLRALGLSLSQP